MQPQPHDRSSSDGESWDPYDIDIINAGDGRAMAFDISTEGDWQESFMIVDTGVLVDPVEWV